MELTGDSMKEWKRIFAKLKPTRGRLVDALYRGQCGPGPRVPPGNSTPRLLP